MECLVSMESTETIETLESMVSKENLGLQQTWNLLKYSRTCGIQQIPGTVAILAQECQGSNNHNETCAVLGLLRYHFRTHHMVAVPILLFCASALVAL